jgi:tetratricopeptide (TPR) repeat protein
MFPSGRSWVLVALALVGCKKEEAASKEKPGPAAAKSADCAPPAEKTGALAWYADDLAAAVKCATARKVPIVIDEWAPWCHTCISMQTVVFSDPALAPIADRFVFLSADTDKEVNADIVGTYPPAAWPTFFVISPHGEIHGRFVGSASVTQFRDFLVESEKSFLAGEQQTGPMAEVVIADRLVVDANDFARGSEPWRGNYAKAVEHYQKALATAPADWPRRPDVLVNIVDAMGKSGDPKACLDFALANLDATGNTSSAVDFLVQAEECAEGVKAQDPAAAVAFREKAIARIEKLIADPAAPLSADDRSDAMMNLRGMYDALGRSADAIAMAEKQRAFLDEAAAKAPDPFAAMTYNWPRSEVYAYLHKHDELVPALQKSAADLPREYDPPYRLAWLYKDAGKMDEALPWAKKAAELAYGPRKARALAMLADIQRAKNDTAGELESRRALVALLKGLPKGQARPDELAKAETDLAALEVVAKQPTN